MLELKIIFASTRQGRKGTPVAQWIHELTRQHSEFNTEFIDLAEVNLPLFDEPNHPRFGKYEHRHTKEWSNRIKPADAFIVVTPEYNYSFPAVLKNAFDYLSQEWNYKPIAFVSYGGVAAGTRAVQAFRQVITALNMMSITESINIPFFSNLISENGKFMADERLNNTAHTMIRELARWAEQLKQMRNSKQ